MLLRLLAGLLLGVISVSAQSFVWQISRGAHSFYLGGTCHVLRAADYPLPAEFDLAYAASARVYFESDLARMQSPEMQEFVAQHGTFTDGKTLADVLTPAAWKAVETYSTRSGLPLEQIRPFKPWLFVVIVTVAELQKLGVSLEGVDFHYFKQAGKDGKPTAELETFEQQLQFMVQLGAGHESELIANALEELGDLPRQVGGMLTAWRNGDVAALDKLMLHDVRTRYPAIYRDLFLGRNRAWLPKLEALAKTPEVEFVLVGAAHLAGKDGLLEQLRARGYTLKQVVAPSAPK